MSISNPTQNQDKPHMKIKTTHVFPSLQKLHERYTKPYHNVLLIAPHVHPIARIILDAVPAAQSVQIQTEAVLLTFAVDRRLDRPGAVVVLERREACKSECAGAPAAADAQLVRVKGDAVTRLDKGPDHVRA